MTASAEALIHLSIPDVEQSYAERDTILYALGVGVGSEPISPAHLAYTYEDGLKPLPSLAVVLGHPGFWPRDLDTGLDWRRIVHGEQTLRLHRPLPTHGLVRSQSRIKGIQDKGEGKGAVIAYERTLFIDGVLTATVGQTLFCRGDGGIGSLGEDAPRMTPSPERPPDRSYELRTLPQTALIYRLSGDLNPLHADPNVALSVGFPKPILHGLATYGVAAFSLLTATGLPPETLRRLDCRFRAPVFPGDMLATDLWRENDRVHFQVRAVDRDLVVLSHGLAEFTDVADQT
ncbi:MaoC/PaaZ C-terminal domain-containing protein [Brevundimonas sp.]|uniref:MaoC/PaaZ C-terminal domain-containing protein n=1 Tax=Brevundimonas sp. TaxID=1871086 RepID=UPI00198C784C|nr:MaoC/PaaZ C-terminal domain-containing protein [Brevundimonas sp.]MBD3837579.1 MaoC family dehydratase N-terminal domain-containing protein [Brevundimonas sp.]